VTVELPKNVTFSPRVMQVLELVLDGATSAEIAKQLGISRRTVEAHRAGILETLELKSMQQLFALFLRLERAKNSEPEKGSEKKGCIGSDLGRNERAAKWLP
jgi:DNA-binding CsgD family transcriptional regulator